MRDYKHYFFTRYKDGEAVPEIAAGEGFKVIQVYEDATTYVYALPRSISLTDFKRWYLSTVDQACEKKIDGKNGSYIINSKNQ